MTETIPEVAPTGYPEVAPTDLQLSPEGYVKVFRFFLSSSATREAAFDRVEQYCRAKGYKPRYSDFESFQKVYYCLMKKRRGVC